MPFIGSILPVGTPGVSPRNKKTERARPDRQRPGEAFARAPDEADLSVNQLEAADAPRPVKQNDSEDAAEERTANPFYQRTGTAQTPIPPRSLDIKG